MFKEGGLFGSGGFFDKAGTAVLSLPNQVISFGEDLGNRLYGGIESASAGFQKTATNEARQFKVDRAGAGAGAFVSNNLFMLLAAAAVLIFIVRK